MTLKTTLMTAAAAYAVGRLTATLTGDDIRVFGERLRSLNGDDIRKYALGFTDDALDRAGLVRKVNTPSAAAMMIGGLGAGMLVGAGLALLFAPHTGRDTRAIIGERVADIGEKVRSVRTNGHSTETPGETTDIG